VVGLFDFVVIFFADEQVAGGRGVMDGSTVQRLLVLGDGGGFLRDGEVFGVFFGVGSGFAVLGDGGGGEQEEEQGSSGVAPKR